MLFMYYHTFYSWLLTDFRYILTYLKHRELFLKKYFTKTRNISGSPKLS